MSRELDLAYAELGLKAQRLNRARAYPGSTRLDVGKALLAYRQALQAAEAIQETL